ncbi:LEF-5 [Dikerogammarus haemobaphes nudivirus]|nr:LEF-5 [Dikerogammarus haemobaphes nudivirus]
MSLECFEETSSTALNFGDLLYNKTNYGSSSATKGYDTTRKHKGLLDNSTEKQQDPNRNDDEEEEYNDEDEDEYDNEEEKEEEGEEEEEDVGEELESDVESIIETTTNDEEDDFIDNDLDIANLNFNKIKQFTRNRNNSEHEILHKRISKASTSSSLVVKKRIKTTRQFGSIAKVNVFYKLPKTVEGTIPEFLRLDSDKIDEIMYCRFSNFVLRTPFLRSTKFNFNYLPELVIPTETIPVKCNHVFESQNLQIACGDEAFTNIQICKLCQFTIRT